jgi:hypothetical protein
LSAFPAAAGDELSAGAPDEGSVLAVTCGVPPQAARLNAIMIAKNAAANVLTDFTLFVSFSFFNMCKFLIVKRSSPWIEVRRAPLLYTVKLYCYKY